jgi:CDP-paratose 2-epimerase
VIRAFEAFYHDLRLGEVYNLGGGRDIAASILELLDRLEQVTGRRIPRNYQEQPRVGDHIVSISNLSKLRAHYPGWEITRSLGAIVDDVLQAVCGSRRT